jgi:hypothetical protein
LGLWRILLTPDVLAYIVLGAGVGMGGVLLFTSTFDISTS